MTDPLVVEVVLDEIPPEPAIPDHGVIDPNDTYTEGGGDAA